MRVAGRGWAWVRVGLVVAIIVGGMPVVAGAAPAPVDSGAVADAGADAGVVWPAWWVPASKAEAAPMLTVGMPYTYHLPLVMQSYAPAATLRVVERVEPWLALPGDVVTTTWVVSSTGALAAEGVQLRVEAPAGLTVLDDGGATREQATDALRWSVGRLAPGAAATVRWVGRVEAAEMTVLAQSAWVSGVSEAPSAEVITATETATVLVGRAVTGTLTPAGGVLHTPSGRVRLEAPAGAVSETTAVRVADYPAPPLEPGELDWVALFDVHAPKLEDGTGHTRFRQPLTVTLNLSGTLDWSEVYLLNFADAAGRAQRPVTSSFDVETDVLTAVQRRFSGDGAVQQNPFPDDGSYVLLSGQPGVSAFSGSAVYELPLETPAGVGGLRPELALAYNSRSVDGTLGVVQSSAVGLGWSLAGVPHIRRVIKTSQRKYTRGDEKDTYTQYEYRDEYTLVLGGRSHVLLASGTGPGGEGCAYETQEHAPLRVVRYNAFCGYGTEGTPAGVGAAHGGEYWVVTTAGGTRYRFGYTAEAEHVALMWGYRPAQFGRADQVLWGWKYRFPGYAGALEDRVAYRWSLDRVTDPHGNEMAYHYHETKRRAAEHLPVYDRAVYLERVEYGGYQVQVERETRGGHDNGPFSYHRKDYSQWQSQRVRGIKVCVGACAQGEVLREYVLAYEEPTLPWAGYEFSHHTDPPEYTLLGSVRTYGQGGAAGGAALPPVTFEYAHDLQADDDLDPQQGYFGGKLRSYRLKEVENGYGGHTTFRYEQVLENHRYSYRVTERTVEDGLGHRARTAYAYEGACIGRRTRSCWRTGEAQRQVIVGHTVVTETAYGYDGGLISAVTQQFHLRGDEARGRAHTVVVRGDDEQVLEEMHHTWRTTTDYGGVAGRYRVELAAEVVTRDGQAQRTAYEYDAHGNVVAVYEHGLEGVTGDERTVRRQFVANEDAWIVDKPAAEQTYAGLVYADDPTRAEARRYWAYDGQAHGAAPLRGAVTREAVGAVDGPYITRYEYDEYGNQVATIDALGRRSETAYDGTFPQFAVRTCNALGQCTHTEYYGVNGPGLGADGASFGAVYRTWGPNGAETATAYRYDAFGRVVAEVRPGPGWDWATPSARFAYHDGAATGLWAQAWQWATPGGDPLVYAVYHDGLGRRVQTRAEAADGRWVVSSQTYDGAGRAARTYVPQFGAGVGYSAPAGDYVETAYDGLGRMVTVTEADGSTTRTGYRAWRTATRDANGHQRVAWRDGLGRLVRVDEFTGTHAAIDWHVGPYATTRYGYDALDHLTTVTDSVGHVTRMWYDELGRKVAMDDPDMGRWRYGYDAVGNLVTQTDALSRTLGFVYDALNRVREKRQAGGAVLAAYAYDQGAYGIGQRTGMTDTWGASRWAYDARGRVISETRMFPGLGAYVTQYSHDGLDRLVALTYPDGEVVTHTYDGGGAPDGLYSSLGETLVAGTTYGAAGQVTERALGNGLVTTYSYDPQTLRLTRLRTADGGAALQDLSYTYDAVGNVATIVDATNGGQVQRFGYDGLDRLTRAWTSGSGAGAYDEAYVHDALGNLVRKDGVAYEYGDPAHVHAATGLSDGSRFAYDANGNMTQRMEVSGTKTITYAQAYDVESRLVAVTATVGMTETVTRFGYDGDGVQVWKARGAETTVYVGEHYEEDVAGLEIADLRMEEIPPAQARMIERPLEDNSVAALAGFGQSIYPQWWTSVPEESVKRGVAVPARNGGDMMVTRGGDYVIQVTERPEVVCNRFRLKMRRVPIDASNTTLFEGHREQIGQYREVYLPAGINLILYFYHYETVPGKWKKCGHDTNPVPSTSAQYADLRQVGENAWQVKFEDLYGHECNDCWDKDRCPECRDLVVRIYPLRYVAAPTWLDTGPACTSGAERTLTWETTAGWWYRVQRATDPNFVRDVVSVDVLAAGGSASHTFIGHGTGTYYYRVQSRGRTNTDASGWTTAQGGHDRSGPGVTHTLSGTQAHGWYRSAVQVSLAAADVGCDGTVAGIEQAVDGAAWQPYAGPFSLADPATHTVRYRASDGRGNVGPVGALEARLDLAGPGGWHDFGPSGWIAQLTSTVRVWGADALSGLDVGTAQVRVSVDEGASWGAWQPATCGGAAGTTSAQELSATVVLSEGVANRVQFRVWDRAGNVGESVAYAVRANRSAPVWGAMVAPVGWTGVLTPEVAVEVRDAEPGLDVGSVEYQYTTDGGQSWSAWQSATCTGGAGSTVTETVGATVPFGRGSVGASHRVRFRVLDGVGNVGQSEPYVVWVDGTGPEVWVAAPERAYGGRVVVAWGATDEQSGVGGRYDVAVRVDGGAWAPVLTDTTALTLAHAIEAGRRYDFRVATADNVGNVGRAEATVYTPRVTKYYHHGGQRVAQRVAVGVVYLHGDHLGSTSLTTDGGGAVVARQLYHPYGTVRWREGALPTDFTYTGQRAVAGTGLMDYRARYYHPTLGRFVSADTVVPEAGNPQDWNRYAFVRNNPLAYTDPTGHVPSPPYPMWPQRKKLAPKLVMRPVRLSHPDDTSGYSAPVMPTPTTMPMPTVTPAPMPESGVDWVSPLDDPIKYWNGYGYYDWGCNIDGSCGCAPYQQPEVEHPDYDCPLCFHNGWDMTSATTNVYAMGDGIVKSSSSANRLDISHVVNGVEIEVQYTHVQYDQEILSSGTAVQAGQLLGNWGAYGTGFGHFHWSVKVDGHVVDPKDYWPGSVPASFTGSWGDPICIPPNCP